MMRCLATGLLALGCVGIWGMNVAAVAQEKEKPAEAKSAPSNEELVQGCIEAYVDAYNKKDAAKLASLWAEEGVYHDHNTGESVAGRKNLEAAFTESFKDDASQLSVTVNSLRFIGDNVAVEEGVAEVTRPGELPTKTSYTAIHVKKDGKWSIDSIRETTHEAPVSQFNHLRDLEWMIGEWVDNTDGASVQTDCKWSKNRNFLIRSFKVYVKDRVDREGTQVIGWDAADGVVRSWTFDADGGFSQGVWSNKGDRWMVKASGVLPDGGRASALQIITPIDENAFYFQVISREIDGQFLPNIDPVKVVRAGTESAAAEEPAAKTPAKKTETKPAKEEASQPKPAAPATKPAPSRTP